MIETPPTSRETSELALRRERAEIGAEIDRASERVQDLKRAGYREGDPELDASTRSLRELIFREQALPGLILDAVAERCQHRTDQLRDEEATLLDEAHALQETARRAYQDLQEATSAAEEARTRVEANEMRRQRLWQERQPYETFTRRARELEGGASEASAKRLRLLEDARADGLLLPFVGDASRSPRP